NTGKPIGVRPTHYNVGPEVGAILNNHFFPAIIEYNAGRYVDAEDNLTYLVNRPYFFEANPRQREFMSTGLYMRGMIYFHHSQGPGRFKLAKDDFQEAVKWNPNNYEAYIELSRVLMTVNAKDDAVDVINRLLERKPDEATQLEAKAE